MRYLHERIHTLREGVMGDSPRNKRWILRELDDIIPIALTDDPSIVKNLDEFKQKIEAMRESDTSRRIQLDQEICAILNAQEKRIRAEEPKPMKDTFEIESRA